MTTATAGTGALIRHVLRRDRMRLTIWLVALALLPAAVASSFAEIYPDPASLAPLAQSIAANPGLRAFTGPAHDLTSIGGVTSWRVTGTSCILASIMNFLLVLRHTRAEEESGRLELLRSAPIGPAAPLAAALGTTLLADLVMVLGGALALIATGQPAIGSLGFCLAVGGCAATFAGIGAVTAQITENSRPAAGLAAAALAFCYLMRAAADSSGPAWLSWLSPIGWAQQLRPFAADGPRWWVLALSVAATAATTATAYLLSTGRDFGSGVFATRPGPAHGRIGSSLALAWRLQRGTLVAWAVGLAVLGGVAGALADSVGDLAESSAQMHDLITAMGGESSIVDAYLVSFFGICGLMAGGYAVTAVLRLSTEEAQDRAELLLSTPVGRLPWALGHLVIALAGVAVLMFTCGLATALSYGLVDGDLAGQLPRLLLGALVQAFAAWVFAGLGLALFGLRPAVAGWAWAGVAGSVVLMLLGDVLDLPQPVLDLSPFTHLPILPGGEPTVTGCFWLLVVTGALCAAGLAGVRHRDLR